MGRAASQFLTQLVERIEQSETITLDDALKGLGASSFGFAILVMSLPALIPLPGPFGIAFGLGLAFIGAQICSGAKRLWLPDWVRQRNLPSQTMAAMLTRAVPWFQSAERQLKPRRWMAFSGARMRPVIGSAFTLLGLAIALPLPLGNILPVIASGMLAIAWMARDGVAVVAALGAAAFALLWTAALIAFGVQITATLWHGLSLIGQYF